MENGECKIVLMGTYFDFSHSVICIHVVFLNFLTVYATLDPDLTSLAFFMQVGIRVEYRRGAGRLVGVVRYCRCRCQSDVVIAA